MKNEESAIIIDDGGIPRDYMFIFDMKRLNIPLEEIQTLSEERIKELMEKRIQSTSKRYASNPKVRNLTTVCELTSRSIKLRPGMVVTARSKVLWCIDPAKETQCYVILKSKLLRVKGVERVKRPGGKKQWCMHFSKKLILPVDWDIFTICDPDAVN